MTTVTVTRLINADIESVWQQISNVKKVENWHPAVATADLLSENTAGLGATRRCNYYDGSDVIEEVIEFGEYEFNLEIREFKFPMKNFTSKWKLTPTREGNTQISITMNYQMKLSLFGTLLDVLVIKGKMPKLLSKVLAGLEHHIVSGEIVDSDFSVAL